MTEATTHTTATPRIAPPSALLQLLELRATWELAAGVAALPWLRLAAISLSSTRPTSVHTLVVPTSMPTTISSMSFTHPVIWRGRIGHIDQHRPNTSLR